MQILGFFLRNIIDYIGAEPYNICNEYIVNPYISVSTIIGSTNIDVQDQIMPTHEFHSLLKKWIMNILYLMMSCTGKINKNPNEPIHLFIIGGASTCKTFTLML